MIRILDLRILKTWWFEPPFNITAWRPQQSMGSADMLMGISMHIHMQIIKNSYRVMICITRIWIRVLIWIWITLVPVSIIIMISSSTRMLFNINIRNEWSMHVLSSWWMFWIRIWMTHHHHTGQWHRVCRYYSKCPDVHTHQTHLLPTVPSPMACLCEGRNRTIIEKLATVLHGGQLLNDNGGQLLNDSVVCQINRIQTPRASWPTNIQIGSNLLHLSCGRGWIGFL